MRNDSKLWLAVVTVMVVGVSLGARLPALTVVATDKAQREAAAALRTDLCWPLEIVEAASNAVDFTRADFIEAFEKSVFGPVRPAVSGYTPAAAKGRSAETVFLIDGVRNHARYRDFFESGLKPRLTLGKVTCAAGEKALAVGAFRAADGREAAFFFNKTNRRLAYEFVYGGNVIKTTIEPLWWNTHSARTVEVDYAKPGKEILPLNGTGGGPNLAGRGDSVENRKAAFASLNVASVRLHDIPHAVSNLKLVDVPQIFPLWIPKADPNDPENYYFLATDDYLKILKECVVKRITYRLVPDLKEEVAKLGYGQAEFHLNEWHYKPCSWGELQTRAGWERWAEETEDGLNGIDAGAFVANAVTRWQESGLSVANYYMTTCFEPCWGLFTSKGDRRPTWWALKFLGTLADGQRVADTSVGDISVLAGVSKDRVRRMVVADFKGGTAAPVTVRIKGIPTGAIAHIETIDAKHPFEPLVRNELLTRDATVAVGGGSSSVSLIEIRPVVDVQAMIDDCAARGGGRVTLKAGEYDSPCLTLRSNVELHLEKGAILRAPSKMDGYPQRKLTLGDATKVPRTNASCFIFAEGATNVAITGEGTIDANGKGFVVPRPRVTYGWKYERVKGMTPPRVVWLLGCQDVRIEGVTMINQPAGWSYWISDCDRVLVEGLKIHANVFYPNNDGVHINSSRDVLVRNCDIDCGDDAIVMRANNITLPVNKVCERVVVSNCTLRSYANGIRIGWINDGVIRNGLFKDLKIRKSTNGIGLVLPPPYTPTDVGREATRFENLIFENIEMDDIYILPIDCAIDSGKATRFDAFENLVFRNVHARGLKLPRVQAPSFKKPAPFIYENCSFECVPETELDTDGENWKRMAHDGTIQLGDYRVKFTLKLADGSFVDAAEMTRIKVEADGNVRKVRWTGHPRLGAGFSAAAELTREGGEWRTSELKLSGATATAPAVKSVHWPEVTEPWVDIGRIAPAEDVSKRPLAVKRSGAEFGGTISTGYPEGAKYVAIANLTAEGKALMPTIDGKVVDLGKYFPDGVKKGEEGTRWIDVAFEVIAPKDGRYTFLFHNDYFGRVSVNGGESINLAGPYDGFTPVALELKEGVNRIVFSTRSGSGGNWTFGAAVAVVL